MESRSLRADLLLLLTAAIWGFAFVAQRAGMEHVGPFTFNAVRFLLGALVLIPLLLRRQRILTSGLFRGGVIMGLLLFAGAMLQQIGIVTTGAGKAGFITGLYVVLVPILGIFLGQRSGRNTWLGAALAVAGLYLLSVRAGLSLAPGDGLILLSAVFWALHVLAIGRLSGRHDPVALAALQYLVCSLLSFVGAFALESPAPGPILEAGLPILYAGLASTGIAYTLQVVAQRRAPAGHAAIILSLEAVFAVIGGWMLLGETLGARGLTGCALMLGGMLLSRSRPGSPR